MNISIFKNIKTIYCVACAKVLFLMENKKENGEIILKDMILFIYKLTQLMNNAFYNIRSMRFLVYLKDKMRVIFNPKTKITPYLDVIFVYFLIKKKHYTSITNYTILLMLKKNQLVFFLITFLNLR